MTNHPILAAMIRDKAATQPDLDVLTFVTIDDDGDFKDEIRTYQELWQNGQRVAAALDAAGMKEGEAFALLMQNHPEFVDCMVGSSIANTVLVPIDPRLKEEKLHYMLDFSECRGVVVADYALPALMPLLAGLKRIEWVWVLDTGEGQHLPSGVRARWFPALREGPVPDMPIRAVDPQAPMQMLFTSGTTGDPKAIWAPHARFGAISALGSVLGLKQDDRPYTGLSLTHANAQLVTLGNVLAMGLRGVISRKFSKSRLWDITRRYGCTMFNLLGGMTTAIYAEPPRPNDRDNPVRYVLSAGMPAALWNDFKKRFAVEIFEFYGTAEGGLTLNPPGAGPVGSIGKAPPTMLCAILDENDQECAPLASGEICFRNADGTAPSVRYYRDPAASARKTRGGWFRSGDIGHKDADGWVYFEYRAGNGIRRNGEFIDPATIEKVIAESRQVADVFVYGLHTETNAPGEKEVVAAVVPADDAHFDPQAMFAHCRSALAANFVPTFLQIVTAIPKTASEKPQERLLVAQFEAEDATIFRDGS